MTREDPMVGRVVDGRYLVRSLIARGGMASVYLAGDQRLDRDVALKVMHGNLAADPEFVTRFIREARSAARLSHPNVVQVFDQGADGPVLYLAMEYLPGRTLRDVLAGRGALTPRESVSVLEPVLGALAAAHRGGIVHGDVKPENVILTDDGRIKVADFGLARAITAPITVTASGELLGTVAYLAPELVSHGVADARADVYAAGIMLFELLTGKQPFTGSDPLQVAYRHVQEPVPAPTQLAPGLPLAFDSVTLAATDRDPDRRPPNAGALLADLHAAARRVPDAQLDVRAQDSAPTRPEARRPEPSQPEPSRPEPTRRARRQGPPPPDADRTAVFDVPPVFDQPTLAPSAPAAAAGPQPTQILAVGRPALQPTSRREARAAGSAPPETGPGSRRDGSRQDQGRPMLPRLRVNDDDQEIGGLSPDRRRLTLAAIGGVVVLVLLIFVGLWWVSGGRDAYVNTPPLAGRQQSDAQRALTNLGLTGKLTFAYDPSVAAGQVVSSVPVAGAQVKKHGVVLLTVSKGPELLTVPSVGGLTVQAATTAIQGAQLKVGSTSTRSSATVPSGSVISSSPKAQTKVTPGSSINLVVSSGAQVIKGVGSGLCMDVPVGVQANETRAVLDPCSGGPNQAWALSPSHQLTLYNGSRCLDVAGASTTDGAAVQIYDCTGGSNQQWTLNPDGSIVDVGSGKCLDATNLGTTPGTPLQIWDCSGGSNQKWTRH